MSALKMKLPTASAEGSANSVAEGKIHVKQHASLPIIAELQLRKIDRKIHPINTT